MLSEKMQAALNNQINAELHSAYIYLSMAAYFADKNLNGFANWMRVQAQEELVHAMKFYDFVVERRGRVLLQAVEAVPTEWPTSLAVFEAAFKHEQKISGMIHEIANLAQDERDHPTSSFLKWFIDEQVEEESSADAVVQQLRLIGDSGAGLFMLDREMGTRTFTPEANAEAG
jgi:ferritin